MSDAPNPPKTTLRVEVVVEGGEARTILTGLQPRTADLFYPPSRFVPYDIKNPIPSADTPVFACSGGHCIAAGGTYKTQGGYPPTGVLAQAYNDPNVAAAAQSGDSRYATPPNGAAVGTLSSGNTWSFTQVPGSGYDTTSGNPVNSSLIVWYRYAGSPVYYTHDATAYHGLLSSGSIPTPHPIPAQLTVTFHESLAHHGSVTLRWNGTHWYAQLTKDTAEVYFLHLGCDYHLLLVTPKGTLALTGGLKSQRPFVWCGESAHDTKEYGTVRVTVTE
jgi:hypothetical protein